MVPYFMDGHGDEVSFSVSQGGGASPHSGEMPRPVPVACGETPIRTDGISDGFLMALD